MVAAIEAAGVSKAFRIPHEQRTHFKEFFMHPLRRTTYSDDARNSIFAAYRTLFRQWNVVATSNDALSRGSAVQNFHMLCLSASTSQKGLAMTNPWM